MNQSIVSVFKEKQTNVQRCEVRDSELGLIKTTLLRSCRTSRENEASFAKPAFVLKNCIVMIC